MKKFLMFAIAATVISNTSFAASAASYVIQPGDTLLGVASKHVIRIENPVPKHNSRQPQPQPRPQQHTTPTGPTITVVEEDTVY